MAAVVRIVEHLAAHRDRHEFAEVDGIGRAVIVGDRHAGRGRGNESRLRNDLNRVGSGQQAGEGVIPARTGRGGCDDHVRAEEIDRPAAQSGLAALEGAVAVGVEEHLAADGGGRIIAEFLASDRLAGRERERVRAR